MFKSDPWTERYLSWSGHWKTDGRDCEITEKRFSEFQLPDSEKEGRAVDFTAENDAEKL